MLSVLLGMADYQVTTAGTLADGLNLSESRQFDLYLLDFKLPNGTGLVYSPRSQSRDFWLFDLATKKSRPLTHLSDHGTLSTFDITPDGKEIVFDRLRDNSDIVLIDLRK